ncbi:hypothetical protein U1Q18_000378 [Sarracenia purpurea var. burkii]
MDGNQPSRNKDLPTAQDPKIDLRRPDRLGEERKKDEIQKWSSTSRRQPVPPPGRDKDESGEGREKRERKDGFSPYVLATPIPENPKALKVETRVTQPGLDASNQ